MLGERNVGPDLVLASFSHQTLKPPSRSDPGSFIFLSIVYYV